MLEEAEDVEAEWMMRIKVREIPEEYIYDT